MANRTKLSTRWECEELRTGCPGLVDDREPVEPVVGCRTLYQTWYHQRHTRKRKEVGARNGVKSGSADGVAESALGWGKEEGGGKRR